ncbi:MAG: hypothetical protein M3R72_07455 [Bacteroidota bacterium]|nr:hypothetical protein [Bacteroidota bacterium]
MPDIIIKSISKSQTNRRRINKRSMLAALVIETTSLPGRKRLELEKYFNPFSKNIPKYV